MCILCEACSLTSSRHSSLEEFDILTEIRKYQRSEDRQRMVKWLLESTPNPSIEHQLARDKHEETTGSWLIDSPELNKWRASKNSLLWLNGGAGSGKSILCSTVIEHIKEFCSNDPDSVVTYWYLTFTDSEKQKVSNFLTSIIANMLSNSRVTPIAFATAYERANNGLEKAGIANLMLMLKSVIAGFDDVFIIVDALDECPNGDQERSKFFGILEDMLSWNFDQLHVLITSRREIDIQESFETISTTTEEGEAQIINIQGSHIQHDIQKFLKHSLEGRRFRFWKPELKEDVKKYLTSKADGM